MAYTPLDNRSRFVLFLCLSYAYRGADVGQKNMPLIHVIDKENWKKLEIVDQWSTRIPPPSRRGSRQQCMDCNWTLFKITLLLSTHTHRWCAPEVWIWCSKPKWSYSPETEKSNMAARWPFWKWHCWKSIGFFPYTQLICYWSLDLIFKAKLEVRIWKLKNPIWPPGSHFESDIAENLQASFHTHK